MSSRSPAPAGCSGHRLPRTCCATPGRATRRPRGSGARRMMQDAHERGQGIGIDHAYAALTVLELGAGRYDAALRAARRIFDHDSIVLGTLALPDLVEAAARCWRDGHRRTGTGAAVGTSHGVGDTVGAWACSLAPRALVANGDEADEHFRVGARRAVALARSRPTRRERSCCTASGCDGRGGARKPAGHCTRRSSSSRPSVRPASPHVLAASSPRRASTCGAGRRR